MEVYELKLKKVLGVYLESEPIKEGLSVTRRIPCTLSHSVCVSTRFLLETFD